MRRICVFCGASPGHAPGYFELAASVGAGLASRGIGVVYGGGSVGMMGAVADAALAAGGEIAPVQSSIHILMNQTLDRILFGSRSAKFFRHTVPRK